MHVIVIGAGIGGLTLAQALRRAGIDVSVHDRDLGPESTGGYRLHLDELACTALRRHLSPAHYQALLGSSAGPATMRRFTFADHRLRVLATELRDPSAETLMVGRVPLRVLLAHGLDDAVRFGATFTHHEVRPDGRVTAHFADGGAVTGDVLVGADGVGSWVAEALAGQPTSRPLGFGGIAARVPLGTVAVPDLLRRGPALALGPRGVGVFLTLHDPAGGAAVAPESCTEVAAVTESPTLMWGLTAAERRLPADALGLDGAELIARAAGLLVGWDPAVRALVAAGDPATAGAFGMHAADPDAPLTPWAAGPVTALGDAVHAMPPTGGRGAATAIRDADVLAEELIAVRDGVSLVPLAVHAFQRRMAGYAAEAVRVSLGPIRIMRKLDGRIAGGVARAALPVVATAARLRSA